MKTVHILVIVMVTIIFSSCGMVKQNIDARANLAKCHYEFERLDLTDIKLGKGFALEALDFDISVKVLNNADSDVAIDHVEGDIFLDKNKVFELAHKKFSRIKPKDSLTEKIATEIPVTGIMDQIGKRPENLILKAKIWVTLLVGESTWETPIAFPVEATVPIPYSKIDALVEQKKQAMKTETEQKAKEEADRKAKEAQEALKKIKSPF